MLQERDSRQRFILWQKVVILVVLTKIKFEFSLLISQLLAKAIPVRGAKFKKSRLRKLKRDFCF
ncbi:hypothetical protein ABRQ05_14555 [Pectobacterium actinidiae]|uniref:hypothetical protein n=1 Tax=Pectobacterium actinidiae TaxID=1507808 RepID=UPI0032EF7D4C